MSVYSLPILLSLLAAAVSIFTDVRQGKIKNFVTLPLMLFGLIWSAYVGGLTLLAFNVVAMVVVARLVSRGGRFGAGDVKLIIGIAVNLDCWDLRIGFVFVAFFFIVLAASAVFVRLKAYRFNVKAAVEKMKVEAMMEMGGVKDANVIVHGSKIKHVGAPIIFTALAASLVASYVAGFVPPQILGF